VRDCGGLLPVFLSSVFRLAISGARLRRASSGFPFLGFSMMCDILRFFCVRCAIAQRTAEFDVCRTDEKLSVYSANDTFYIFLDYRFSMKNELF
jgi:hypothetical protein